MTRPRTHLRIASFAMLGLVAAGFLACSEVSDDPLPPTGPAGKAHSTGWLTEEAPDFHGQAIRAAGWDMSSCQSCHGQDYAGGPVDVTCLTCHARTPESCSTCHGTAGAGAGPPEDLQGNSDPGSLGVGAHQAHLRTQITTALACADCHVFAGFADPRHIDGDGRAEVTLGSRAALAGHVPTYDPATASCADSYCHGGGRFGSGASEIVWNDVGTDAGACGTCHSIPPDPATTGHTSLALTARCDACHGSVVEVDAGDPSIIRIIAPALHMNGRTDLNRPATP